MMPRYQYGQAVRVIRNVRNDGTFPGTDTGDLLIRRGSVGYVRDVGTFLQDKIIYSVDFLEQGRMVGCREEELIDADESWTPSRFEAREKVLAGRHLARAGEVIVERGAEGEVLRVHRNDDGVDYEVRFPGRTLLVPERALDPFDRAEK
jgi:nitrogen fixation protein NifZ